MVSIAPIIRVRLEVLCNFHTPVLRAGEERLRAAMAEYAQALTSPERDVGFCTSFGRALNG